MSMEESIAKIERLKREIAFLKEEEAILKRLHSPLQDLQARIPGIFDPVIQSLQALADCLRNEDKR